MSRYSGPAVAFEGIPPVADDASPRHVLGQSMESPDGRKWRYVGAGAVALIVGNLISAEAEDTGEQGLTPEAAAVGAFTITTNSTVTVTANEYAGGFVVVTTTPGLGQVFRIKSHPAATAAAVVLTLEDPVQVALTTGSRIDLVPNLYDNVIQTPTGLTGTILGVAVNDISIDRYGWIQTRGPASCLAQGALTVGNAVFASTTTAGAVVNGATDGSTGEQPYVGIAITGVATTENGLVNLKID